MQNNEDMIIIGESKTRKDLYLLKWTDTLEREDKHRKPHTWIFHRNRSLWF